MTVIELVKTMRNIEIIVNVNDIDNNITYVGEPKQFLDDAKSFHQLDVIVWSTDINNLYVVAKELTEQDGINKLKELKQTLMDKYCNCNTCSHAIKQKDGNSFSCGHQCDAIFDA